MSKKTSTTYLKNTQTTKKKKKNQKKKKKKKNNQTNHTPKKTHPHPTPNRGVNPEIENEKVPGKKKKKKKVGEIKSRVDICTKKSDQARFH